MVKFVGKVESYSYFVCVKTNYKKKCWLSKVCIFLHARNKYFTKINIFYFWKKDFWGSEVGGPVV